MSKDIVNNKAAQITEAGEKYEPFNTRGVVKTLEGLMDKVTHGDVTAEKVNAACNCAGRIADILRIHLDVERLRRQRP